MAKKTPRRQASLQESPYRLRKVLVKQTKGCAAMTMAKFVPWGIPMNPPGFRCATLALYLGVPSTKVLYWAKRLGLELFYDAPLLKQRYRAKRSKSKMVTQEGAARIIAHARAMDGRKLLRARA